MAIRPNKEYVARVTGGAFFESRANLTPGYQVFMDCEDGSIDHTIWLTPKNMKKVAKDFKVLGVEMDKLSNPSFLKYELGRVIAGREVRFEAAMEEYNGDSKLKVAWIGRVNAASEEEIAAGVASLFKAAASGSRAPQAAAAPTADEEIPF